MPPPITSGLNTSLGGAPPAAIDLNQPTNKKKRTQASFDDLQNIQTRIAKVEEAPAADGKRLDDLEKRVRTVEGAVGSAGYKAAKDAPAPTTFKGPDATAPVADKPASGPIFGQPGPA